MENSLLSKQTDRFFLYPTAKSCDATEQTNDMAKVEPLREFTMLQRDPGFEDKFNE